VQSGSGQGERAQSRNKGRDRNRDEISRAGYLKENYHYFHLRDTAGQERDFHFHEFDKLVLLVAGAVDYCVESSIYAMEPWDVLLVRHHTIHKALIDVSRPYERVILYLDRKYFERVMPGTGLMECFDAADKRGSYLLKPESGQREELRRTVEAYETADRDGRFGSQAMRETLIIQFLIHVSRMAAAGPGAESGPDDAKIQQALSYINEHFRSPLTVEGLADQVYLSRYHFMRLFKAQTGSTVHAYIRQKRLMCAARLIREGMPAGKAAADSGFADYSTFHRAFRETFGTSPGQLKR